jgi:hypothetical protein
MIFPSLSLSLSLSLSFFFFLPRRFPLGSHLIIFRRGSADTESTLAITDAQSGRLLGFSPFPVCEAGARPANATVAIDPIGHPSRWVDLDLVLREGMPMVWSTVYLIIAVLAGIIGIWNLARQRAVFLSLAAVLWFLIVLFERYIPKVYDYHIAGGLPALGSLSLYVVLPIFLILAFFTVFNRR